MKLYKITDKDGMTKNDTHWGKNVTHRVTTRGNELCSGQVLHAYKDPYLAVFHNPIGGNYEKTTMLLWEAKGRVVADDGMKVGCKTLTTIKQIEKPELSTEQRVTIAIRCALEVYNEPSFIKWANDWLDGTNRTEAAARAAARTAAWTAAEAAAWAAEAAEAAAEAANIDITKIIYEVIRR